MSFETLKDDLKRIDKRISDYKYVDAKQVARDNIIPFLENLLTEVDEQFTLFSEAIEMVQGETTVIQQIDGERIARHLVLCKEIYDSLAEENPLKAALLTSMQDIAALLEETVVVEESEDEEGEGREGEEVEGEEAEEEEEEEEEEETR